MTTVFVLAALITIVALGVVAIGSLSGFIYGFFECVYDGYKNMKHS